MSAVTPDPEPAEPPDAKSGGTNNATIIFIAIAVVVVGGVGYYFKILRPKKSAEGSTAEDDYEDDYDDEDYGEDGEDE